MSVVRCKHCGVAVGDYKQIHYPKTSQLYDKVDYEFIGHVNYGGESVSGHDLCIDCYDKTALIYMDK